MTLPALAKFEPRTALEAAETIRAAAAKGQRLAFSGGGTHAAPRSDPPDAVISTLGMREVVEYTAEDQTVTVEAGITLADLGRRLAINGQRLVVDVAEPERATVGGAIAANAFGPRRMRYGSLKDLILGVTLVRADGTAARAGGKVVKNVAGFDLSKLVVGSYGTLALVTAATLRVHPQPEKIARRARCRTNRANRLGVRAGDARAATRTGGDVCRAARERPGRQARRFERRLYARRFVRRFCGGRRCADGCDRGTGSVARRFSR